MLGDRSRACSAGQFFRAPIRAGRTVSRWRSSEGLRRSVLQARGEREYPCAAIVADAGPDERPRWLAVGGRWPSALCVLIVLPLAVGLHVLFAYWEPSVRVGFLTEVVLLTFVLARSRAIRWHDVVSVTATLCVANFLFFVGPARWIWPYLGFSTLRTLRFVGTPTVIAGACGQVVLALLLLAGLDPQLRTNIRAFGTPVGRGFVLRAAGAIVLVSCALWSGRHLANGGTLVQVRIEYVIAPVEFTSCVRLEPSIAPTSPAPTSCVGPANQSPTAIQPGADTPKS